MKINGNIITSDEGKVFRRISDGLIFGDEIWLGYTHYINNVKLDEPLLEKPEHYEEIDIPDDMKEMYKMNNEVLGESESEQLW